MFYELDVRTIILNQLITDVVCALVLAFLWQQNRSRFAGISFWVVDFGFQAAATLLIILRGSVPDWMSTVFSNSLVIAGALLGYMGLERFVGKKSSQVHNYILRCKVFMSWVFDESLRASLKRWRADIHWKGWHAADAKTVSRPYHRSF